MAELRRLPYRPLQSLRISRERFCLHPFVQQASFSRGGVSRAVFLPSDEVGGFLFNLFLLLFPFSIKSGPMGPLFSWGHEPLATGSVEVQLLGVDL